MPRPGSLGNVNDPPITDPEDPPLSETRPARGHSPRPQTTAEQGKALPIVYGQGKVAAQLVEKQAPTTTNAPLRRTASSQVYAGEYRTVLAYLVQGVGAGNDGSFLCTQTGVTGAAADFTSGSLITVGQAGIVDGGCLWTCISLGNCEVIASQQFTAALCEGEIVGAINLYWDKEVGTAVSLTNPGKGCGLAVGPDAATQSLVGYAVENYQHTAVIFALAAPTGTQKEIPAIAVELKGVMFGGAGPDVSPADILNDLLTHTRRGAGWVSSRVDSSITGSGVSGYRVYCDAFGLRVSMVIDSQQTAAAIIAALLAATNCEAVWSQGSLHCVPLGDTSSSSPVFGATNYTAPSAAVASFGAADFLDTVNPVQVQRRDDSDCYNAWPIEFTDRSSRYARATVEDQVLDDVEVRGGVARAGVTSYPIILPNGKAATMLSRILGNRSIKNRNTYTFRVSWASGVLIEPCDLLTLTEPGIGFVNTPVRVTSVAEAEDGTFSITAEDWPVGVQTALAYTPQANDGLRTNDRGSLASIGGGAAGTRPVPAPTTVGAAQVGVGQVGRSNQPIGNAANLWPNPTSEITPPANADTGLPVYGGSDYSTLVSGSAEWYGRTFAAAAWLATHTYVAGDTVVNGGNGYGCSVGGVSAGAGGPTGTGTGIVDGAGSLRWDFVTASTFSITGGAPAGRWVRKIPSTTSCFVPLPVVPGDVWVLKAKGYQGAGSPSIAIVALDAAGNTLGSASYTIVAALGGWETMTATLTAPAGTVILRAALAGGSPGNPGYFDSLYLGQVPPQVYGEVPTGTVNGTNPTFTLALLPIPGSETVYVSGVKQTKTTHYTISGSVITFLAGFIPLTGEVVAVDYVW